MLVTKHAYYIWFFEQKSLLFPVIALEEEKGYTGSIWATMVALFKAIRPDIVISE